MGVTPLIEFRLDCAVCGGPLTPVRGENCRVCAEHGPSGALHVTCENPRCPLQLDPRKTVVCVRLNPGGPEA